MKSSHTKPLRRALDLAAAAVVALWLFPIYWILLTSFKTDLAINTPTPTFRFTPTLHNYRDVMSNYGFAAALRTSVIVVTASTAIVVVLGFMAAYALARMKMRRGDATALFILSFRFMPGVVFIIPYFFMAQRWRLVDTYEGLMIVYVAFGLPFAVWLMRGFLMELPRDLEDAARLDGLRRFAVMRRIVLPLALPGVAVAAMFTFVFTWNEYLYALILGQVHAVTAPVALSKMIGAYSIEWGVLSAAIVVQLVPMIVVVFLLQRHITRGLGLGAVR